MKTILLIILIFSSVNIFSQWEKITYEPIIVTKPYAVNGDSLYVFRDKVGWWKSFDSDINWVFDNNVFRNDESKIMFPRNLSPIFKGNYIYVNDDNSGLLQISSDYGESFNRINENSEIIFSGLNNLLIKDDILYGTSYNGLFISFDNGFTWHDKNLPGIWQLSDLGYKIHYENPEEIPGGVPFSNATGIAVLDSSLLISSLSGNDGGVYKTINYHKNDSLNTVLFPVTQEFFLKKYGNHDFYSKLKSFNILYYKGIVYVILSNSFDPGYKYSKIWTSKDEGITWEEQDYSNFGLDTIKEITYCGDYLYAIQDAVGVFMSSDEGKTWDLLNDGFQEIPDEQKSHLRFGNLNFTEKYAYISNGWSLYRAPLKDCKIVSETSSVESTSTEPQIYPNPASESITISGIGQGKVEIYNTLGQKLIEKEIFGTSTINTSTLQTGMYVIKLESGGEVVFEKVIVNK